MLTIHCTAALVTLLVLSCTTLPSVYCLNLRPQQQEGVGTAVSQQYRQVQQTRLHRRMLASGVSALDQHMISRTRGYVTQEEAMQHLLHRCALFNIPPHQCHSQRTRGGGGQQLYHPTTGAVQPTGYLLGGPDDMGPTSSSSSSGNVMEWQQALGSGDAYRAQQGVPLDALHRVQHERMTQLVQKAQQRCWMFALTMSFAQIVMLVLGVAIGVHLQDIRLSHAWGCAVHTWESAWGVQALPGHLATRGHEPRQAAD